MAHGAWTLGEFPLPLTSSRPRLLPQAEPDARSLSDRLHRPGRTLISRHGNGPTSSRHRAAVTCPEVMAAFSRGHFSPASVRPMLPGMPASRESRRRSGRGPCPGCHGDSWCGTDCITSVPKASRGGLARSSKCLICCATDPDPSRGTEVPILFQTAKTDVFRSWYGPASTAMGRKRASTRHPMSW